MVVSLYVCDIPENVTRGDLESLFMDFEGFKELRTKTTNDKKKIAFVDFDNEREANFAKKTLQNFQFTVEDKGLNIKLSDNSKKGGRSSHEHMPSSFTHNKRRRSLSDRSDISNKKEDNNNNLNKPSSTNQMTSIPSSSGTNYSLLKLLTSQPINPLNSLNPSSIPIPDNKVPEQNQLFDFLNKLQQAQLLYNQIQKQNNIPAPKLNTPFPPSNALDSFDEDFLSLSSYKRNATHIVYVEGIPVNATEREVAHIFRPFPGYRSLRLIQKDKNGDKNLICFADFENIIQSTICINTLQGYRFDKNDLIGLRFSYGVSKNKK